MSAEAEILTEKEEIIRNNDNYTLYSWQKQVG